MLSHGLVRRAVEGVGRHCLVILRMCLCVLFWQQVMGSQSASCTNQCSHCWPGARPSLDPEICTISSTCMLLRPKYDHKVEIRCSPHPFRRLQPATTGRATVEADSV